jgi:hypothetical protein
MQRRTASIVVAVALMLGAALAEAPAFASSQESRFTSLTNHERSSRGIRTLSVAGDLVSIARRHSEQMASRGYIYHNGNLQNEVGGNWTELGENVGKGQSVDSIHDAFMNSSEHRANILRRSFNQVGIGTAVRDGYIYVTEVFAQRGSAPAYHRPVVHHVVRHTRPRPPARHPHPVRAVKRAHPRVAAPAAVAAPRTLSVLIRLIGLDARLVSPVTGEALGI